jgi:hypothetical protein
VYEEKEIAMRAGMFVLLVAPVLFVSSLACNKTGDSDTMQDRRSEGEAVTEPVIPKPEKTIEQAFRGSSFPISSTKETTTTLHSFLAKGSSGVARVNALLVYKTHVETSTVHGRSAPATDDRCPAKCGSSPKSCKYGVKLVSMTWVQTYNDGSAFTGALPNAPGDAERREKYFNSSYVCTNGGDFYINVTGMVIDGKGQRFKGLQGGDWSVQATTSTYLTDGTFTATLQY